jgi:hypothetical protein
MKKDRKHKGNMKKKTRRELKMKEKKENRNKK